MYSAKSVLSTAKESPLGTEECSLASIINEPKSLISSFSKPQALSNFLFFKEFEQTSSPNKEVWCASVLFFGLIS